jgi:two-component system, OmpR family, response regulator MprA
MRVLIVEDDLSLAATLRESLEAHGLVVLLAHDRPTAWETAWREAFDVAVLDVMLPGDDDGGFHLAHDLREAGFRQPLLFLSARDAVPDRVRGLGLGDDYLPKPFALEELLARLRALLRRTGSRAEEGPELRLGDLTLDPGTRDVRRGDRPIRLTRTEFSLLELLLRHPRQVLTRDRILEEVWGYDFPTTANSLEVYVGYLRRKTEAEDEPRLIHTVRGVGYVARETPP